MRIYYSLIALALLVACSNTASKINNKSDDKITLRADELSGDWKFVAAELVKKTPLKMKLKENQPVVDEYGLLMPPYIGPDLHFEMDSMYFVNYPQNLNGQTIFALDSGYLLTFDGQELRDNYPIEKKNDTLLLYKWYDGDSYIKESYVKTDLNDSIMRILKTYGVNYPELAGTWFLLREDSGNDGSEYTLKFPFNIPDSIKLSREELIQVTKNNMVYWMPTSGKKRDYVLSYWWGNLNLTPGKWYKREDPRIHFYKG